MINITDKKNCSGCCACIDVCPTNAIHMKVDIEGFWYPEINDSLCIDCSLCDKTCPDLNIDKLKKNDLAQSECFAAEHKNLEVVFDSTSGGLFSAFAEQTYRSGGYVGGAIFNSDFSVSHYLSDNKEDLEKLRSSKYLQSDLSGWYKKVHIALKTGKQITVCGCPCQMAGLRSFLKKDYENLLILDFICRGINSPKVWLKYLESFKERYGSKVIYAKAKSKEYGWRNLTQKVILEDGRAFYETGSESLFTKGYLRTNAYCRPSCYVCKYKGFPRVSDVTLADFWKIEKQLGLQDKDLGVSLVMVNSSKGKRYFEKIQSKILCIPSSLSLAIDGNPALVKPLTDCKVDRSAFFADLDKMSFLDLASKYNFDLKDAKLDLVKRYLKKVRSLVSIYRFNLLDYLIMIYENLKLTGLVNLLKLSSLFLPKGRVVFQKHKKGKLHIQGKFIFGYSLFRSTKLESRLYIGENANLFINGSVDIGYGSDIELFNNSELILSDGVASNIGLTVICANKITIGKNVKIGRNVTIRDNNGGHYINRQGYKNSKPIVIEDKVWLCEGCTIMSGVKIGEGAIIGANALVTRNVPAHAMVVGNPAQIVDQNILWKY